METNIKFSSTTIEEVKNFQRIYLGALIQFVNALTTTEEGRAWVLSISRTPKDEIRRAAVRAVTPVLVEGLKTLNKEMALEALKSFLQGLNAPAAIIDAATDVAGLIINSFELVDLESMLDFATKYLGAFLKAADDMKN